MRLYSIGQISNSEKSNILDKHREMYNGYRQVNQPVSNEQPLYVQDFANDKNGITVNNRGEVKKYTNMGINEQWQAFAADAIATELGGAELAPFIAPTISQKLSDLGEETNEDEMCSECGGMMEEGMCSECGTGMYESNDGDTDEGIYDVAEPFNKSKNKFDYTDEQEMYETHNDYEPMTSAFDGPDYYRVRLGIGRPMGQQDPADFVLKAFSKVVFEVSGTKTKINGFSGFSKNMLLYLRNCK
jgi:hypothetical protein